MSLSNVHKMLANIKDTSGSNDKVSLLKEYLEAENFKSVIQLMYDDSLHYGVKELGKYVENNIEYAESEIFFFLKQLAKQRGTSNADKEQLLDLCSCDKETYEVVYKIVNKDAKCGFSAKLINKAVPGLVYQEPYMRCSTDKQIHRISWPAYAQQKADGVFTNIVMKSKKSVKFYTRNGKKIYQLRKIRRLIKKRLPEKYYGNVLHGELLVQRDGVILDRKTGNGIISSCLNGTAKQEDADQVIVQVWDVIPIDDYHKHSCDKEYFQRWTVCKDILKLIRSTKIKGVPTKTVSNLHEAEKFYRKMRRQGHEGAIIKDFRLLWKYHTSTLAIKMKNVSDAELKIVRIKKGKKDTKWANHVGSIECESECGLLSVSVGGLSDAEHEKPMKEWEKEVGSVVTLQFDSVITDKKTGNYSLYLPRNLEFRRDRTVADTLEEIKKRVKK